MTAHKIEFAKFKSVPAILISGGASPLAYFVTKLLFSSYKQIKIIAIDNLETGSEENIKEFKADSRYTFIKYDLNEGVPENTPPVNCILHLAAVQTHPQEEDSITLDSLLTNAFATKNLLELSKNNKARFLLASSINVYQGLLSSLNLKNYFGPTALIEKKFSHIEAKRYAEALCWEYYKKYDMDLRIVRLGELYGPKQPLFGSIGTVLKQVIEEGLIGISGDGLEKENYVYVEDASEAIAKAILAKNTKGKIFPIAYEKPISLIELAYLLKAVVSKDVKIRFLKENHLLDMPVAKNIARDNLEIISWKPKTSLEEGIRKTLKYHNFLDVRGEKLFTLKIVEEEKFSPPAVTLANIMKREKSFIKPPPLKLKKFSFSLKTVSFPKKAVLYSALFILAALIVPIILYFSNFYLETANLLKAQSALQAYNVPKAQDYAKKALAHSSFTTRPPLLVSFASNIANKKSFLNSASHFSKGGTYSSEAIKSFAQAINSLNTPNNSLAHISKTEEFLMLAEAEYTAAKDFKIFNFKARDFLNFIKNYSSEVSHIKTVLPFMPKILGFENPVTYLFLVQNSTELTPLGGALSSLVKITFENGKATDIVVDDVYNFNSTLSASKTAIKIPPDISEYISQNTPKLENVMYIPDFPEASKNIIALYKYTEKKELDAVFAVDLEFVKNLLDVTGPLFLSYYDATIGEDNIYEKAQFYTEYGNTPDSQKKNFLSTTAYKIADTLFSEGMKANSYQFLALLDSAFNKKHILAYFRNNSIQNSFYALNWCGDMPVYNKDYIYAMDTNIGETRSNRDIKKTINYTIQETADDLYKAHITISFAHTGESNAWPGGIYKNLFRLYTPQGAVLTKATYTNKVEVVVTKDIKAENYKNFTVFPVLMQVGAGETAFLDMYYTLPKFTSPYNLIIQKQPGVYELPFTFSFLNQYGAEVVKRTENIKSDVKIDISSN